MLLVTGEEDRSVYFLVGHGERNPSTQTEEGYLVAAEALRAEGYDIRALDLQTTTIAPGRRARTRMSRWTKTPFRQPSSSWRDLRRTSCPTRKKP